MKMSVVNPDSLIEIRPTKMRSIQRSSSLEALKNPQKMICSTHQVVFLQPRWAHKRRTMKTFKLAFIALSLAASGHAIAQQQSTIASESRDASLAYIGTMNFIVGRVGSECLSTLGRSESPQKFVAAWQQRNTKHLNAAAMYMEKRLEEAQANGGAEKKASVFRAVTSVSRANGETVIRSWFAKDTKEVACERAVGLVEAGAFDFTPKMPMFSELESLALWAQK
jgi:hypothetical protein